jgi:hypothetical protein
LSTAASQTPDPRYYQLGNVVADGATTGLSPEAHAAKTLSFKDFGAKGDGTTDDTDALTAAINWLNGARFRALRQIGGQFKILSALPAITQSDVSIIGEGAMIVYFGTAGNIFTFGSTSTASQRVQVRGFTFWWTGSVDANAFFLDLVNCTDGVFSDFSFIGAVSLIRYGSATKGSARNTFRNWTGNCGAAGAIADANILILNGSAGRFDNLQFNAASGPGVGNTKAYIKFAPPSGANCDTFWFDKVGFQFFTSGLEGDPATSDGKGYGFVIDRTLGVVTNIWLINSGLDHTTTQAVLVTDTNSGSAVVGSRNINIINNRFGTDAGGGVLFDFSSAVAAPIIRAISVRDNYIGISDNSVAIRLRGRTSFENAKVLANRIGDLINTTAKTVAISFDCSNITVAHNSIGPDQTSTGWQAAVRAEHGDNDNFIVADNLAPLVPTYMIEPTYTAISTKRKIVGGDSIQTIALTSDVTNSSTVVADVTGMAFPVKAGGVYIIDYSIIFQTAATTTGIGLTVDGLSDLTSILGVWRIATNQTTSAAETVTHMRAVGTLTNSSAS